MQIDVDRLVRRATAPLAEQVADLAARLAIAQETVEAQRDLIAQMQAKPKRTRKKPEEAAP